MQPSHETIETFENELYQSYTLPDKIRSLKRLYFFAAFQLLIAFISMASSFYIYLIARQLEFLLLCITNFIVILNSILDIYWCHKYPPLLTDQQIDEDYLYQELLQSSQQISYIHSLLSQISLAFEIALFFCLIHFNTVGSQLWIAVLQVFIIILLGYMVFVGYIYTHNIIGTKRFIIYFCVIVVLLFSSLASIFMKQVQTRSYIFQCLMEIHLQIYVIDPALIKCIKTALLLTVIMALLIGIANIRRMKPLFAPLAFVFLLALILQTIINGTFIRQIQEQQRILDTKAGCRFTMEVIGQKSLENIGCKEKYLNQEFSPFLPCKKAEQSYMWEQDLNKAPALKLNTLACLNTSCCPVLSKNVLYYPKSLTILSTFLVAIGFVLACNLLALTKQQFKVFQIRVYGEIAVIILIAIIIASLALLVYNYEPIQPEQVQPQLVQMDEVIDLKRPAYKRFQEQSPIDVDYNLENCQLAQSIMLEHIQLNGDTSSFNEPGVRIAISGTNGVFACLGNINSEYLWYLTSKEVIDEVFANQKSAKNVQVDYIIFQGGLSLVDYFVNTGLFFCTDDPLNANFEVVQEYIDLKQLSPEYEKQDDGRRQLIQKEISYNKHEDSQESTSGSGLVNKFGNLQLNNLKFFQTKITVRDLELLTPIPDTDVFLYFGGYMLSSCQVITKLEPHRLYGKTDANGVVKFHNLDQGYLFTVLVSAKNYKHGCALIDLTALTNQQLHYKVYLTNQFNSHSMRLVLQWEGDTDFDLYGIYEYKNNQCVTGPLSRTCGGMEHQQARGIEWLSVNQLEPFEYLFFVTRYLSHEDAIKKISQKDIVQINQDVMNSKLKLAIYVNELDYPLLEYPMPIFKKSEYNEIELVWLSFCVNGKQGDAPKGLQKYWSQITMQDVLDKKGMQHPTWPSVEVCHKK